MNIMQITYRTDNDMLYIAVAGRVDASNAPAAEEEISRIQSENAGKHTVIDADNLEYISSAGHRVILKFRKQEPKLAIVNVSPEVYNIFDMTGFTDMVTIEKAYRRLSVEGCEFLAKGANGAVYRYDDETIVKTYYNKDALPEIQQERENARKAFVLGVNTAIPYDIVRVGDGYGTVTELLNATSVSKLIKANPADLTQAVAYYVDTIKHIHSIKVEKNELPDFKDWVLGWADFLTDYLPADTSKKLHDLILALPESEYMMHGDYHTNNIMVQNGETLLIDMDTLSVGCPVLELGSMYNAFVGFSELDHQNVADFLGFDFETAEKFWRMSLARYFGTEDEEILHNIEQKAKVIGYTRILRRCIRNNDTPTTINHYKKQLTDLLDKVDTLNI